MMVQGPPEAITGMLLPGRLRPVLPKDGGHRLSLPREFGFMHIFESYRDSQVNEPDK